MNMQEEHMFSTYEHLEEPIFSTYEYTGGTFVPYMRTYVPPVYSYIENMCPSCIFICREQVFLLYVHM
jgi:hypothetical protein